VVTEVRPGDVDGMVTAIAAILKRSPMSRQQARMTAQAEAARLFTPEVVCSRISTALQRLVEEERGSIAQPRSGVREPEEVG
jgi:hypothetical protein